MVSLSLCTLSSLTGSDIPSDFLLIMVKYVDILCTKTKKNYDDQYVVHAYESLLDLGFAISFGLCETKEVTLVEVP